MGARAGWRWISVVVMGRRFPVRLSLRPTRYVLQDKRRRVRITGRRCTVIRFSLSISLDRRSRLSGKFMCSEVRVLHEGWNNTAAKQRRRDRSSVTLSLSLDVRETFSVTFTFTFTYFR